MTDKKMETTIEIALAGLLFAIVIVMFWSISVSKQLSIVVFSVIFLGITVAMIVWQGFTQKAFGNIGVIAFVLFMMWLGISKRIAETTRARGHLVDRLSQGKHSTCGVCGSKKLTYHRMPKNISQLLLGGLTCDNCGAEIDVPIDIFLPK